MPVPEKVTWRRAMKFNFLDGNRFVWTSRLLHAAYQFSASESDSNYPFAPLLQATVGPAYTCSRFYIQALKLSVLSCDFLALAEI
jgi:hypothetical protein